MGLTKAVKLYNLYLDGASLTEIADSNEIDLEEVVDACVRYRWYQRREEALNSLFDSAKVKYVKAQSEAISYSAVFIGATNKKYGDKLKKYLETGDESLITGIDLSSFKTFKEAVEVLKTLTSTGEKKISGEVTHKHTIEEKAPKKKLAEPQVSVTDLVKLLDAKKN